MKLISQLAFSILILTSQEVGAREFTIQEMTREEEVMLNRGFSYADVVCGMEIINEIIAYGGEESMAEFVVDLNSDFLTVRSQEAEIVHKCVNGLHIMYDHGRTIKLDQYGDDDEIPGLISP